MEDTFSVLCPAERTAASLCTTVYYYTQYTDVSAVRHWVAVIVVLSVPQPSISTTVQKYSTNKSLHFKLYFFLSKSTSIGIHA